MAHKQGRVLAPVEVHERVKKLYTWQDIARRTEVVYDKVTQETDFDFVQRLKRKVPVRSLDNFPLFLYFYLVTRKFVVFKKYCLSLLYTYI